VTRTVGEATAFETASRTHVGLVRQINEDRVLVQPDIGLWAIADGMGGHSLGDRAAVSVVAALSEVGSNPPSETDIVAALRSANASILAMGRNAGVTCGSTIAGLAISPDAAFVFWVGDSRVYRVRGGELTRLTSDHSIVQELCDAGVLTEQQARRDGRKNIITRAVGIGEDVTVDVVKIDARAGDLFLICSDGLSDMVDDDELMAHLTSRQIENCVDTLVRAALAAGGTDNVSVTIVALAAR
jgi:serine/threonine protein phosphatase PrpC